MERASKYTQYANAFNPSWFRAQVTFKALDKQRQGMLGLCHDNEVQILLVWNSNKPLQTCTS